MLTVESALAYAATIAPGYTFAGAYLNCEDGVEFVFIGLHWNGVSTGRMDVWVENGPNGPYLHGEY